MCDSDQEGRSEGDRRGLDACGMHSSFIFRVICPIMGSTAQCLEHKLRANEFQV